MARGFPTFKAVKAVARRPPKKAVDKTKKHLGSRENANNIIITESGKARRHLINAKRFKRDTNRFNSEINSAVTSMISQAYAESFFNRAHSIGTIKEAYSFLQKGNVNNNIRRIQLLELANISDVIGATGMAKNFGRIFGKLYQETSISRAHGYSPETVKRAKGIYQSLVRKYFS